jgi:hypothetical protein
VRKSSGNIAHRAEQDGTWLSAPLYTRTLCSLKIKADGTWREVGQDVQRHVGRGPGFLLQACERCAAREAKLAPKTCQERVVTEDASGPRRSALSTSAPLSGRLYCREHAR